MADFEVNQSGAQRPAGTTWETNTPLGERLNRTPQRGRAAEIPVESLLGREEDGVLVSLSKRTEPAASLAVEPRTSRIDNQVTNGYRAFSGTGAGGVQSTSTLETLPGAFIDILI
jgi:hypothetical protein